MRASTRDFRFSWTVATLCAVLFATGSASGQRSLQEIPAADPDTELASFKVADGFQVNLWAADPLLAKPTQITFDREGKLWSSCSETYPQLNVNQEPTDRIVILQDTNADGVADKSSVYYDKLLIPGGVLPDGQGGAYVAHAKELLHLHDRNHDGCLLYTSPSPRDRTRSRMPSSA